ncbi:DNA-binding transcriptional regulator, MarR family [Carnobacterium iners]|uniref:DNA-binding transcriptional regulator, MarR family n=1 Tax=Carnobacterium iners TaxID=1073423 RepID=A0A1X7MXL5_9LACT|nr:MarR family transcriptional regulator [Carnobacterium iners]SEK18424.1 DNA-binding transcriptional regulator, MarR family [Carnobacterium iners]SMH29634.1 DNA-binding transcriptional regulator, MarR family [Carnobacterium iners]
MEIREISKLFYKIKISNQETTSFFEKETGFSLTRFEMMLFLKENDKCLQSQIQSELKIDRSAVTRHLKILEEKNYVTRERNEVNNREIFVRITEKAKTELNSCEKKNNAMLQPLNISLNTEEAEQLSYLLNKLIN